MKKSIALIYGGDSSEWEVSVKSGKHMLQHIDREKYDVYEVFMRGREWSVIIGDQSYPIDKADFSFRGFNGDRVSLDMALIMIHGTPGEDGVLQAYLEMVGVPFSTCSSRVSAITFDKYACKCYLRDTGIAMAKEIFLHKGDSFDANLVADKLGMPLFVKPNDGGSSFGVTKVKHPDQLHKAVTDAFNEGDRVLIEEFIEGREMTNGVYMHKGEIVALPVTEIIPHNEFFDYEAKYLGASNEVCPAEISAVLSDRIREMSKKLYHHLGCNGVVRMDYIVRGEEIFFLEINTVPGMTEMSLVPQQIRASGMTIADFLTDIIESISIL